MTIDDKVMDVFINPWIITPALSLACFGTGAFVGYCDGQGMPKGTAEKIIQYAPIALQAAYGGTIGFCHSLFDGVCNPNHKYNPLEYIPPELGLIPSMMIFSGIYAGIGAAASAVGYCVGHTLSSLTRQ